MSSLLLKPYLLFTSNHFTVPKTFVLTSLFHLAGASDTRPLRPGSLQPVVAHSAGRGVGSSEGGSCRQMLAPGCSDGDQGPAAAAAAQPREGW